MKKLCNIFLFVIVTCAVDKTFASIASSQLKGSIDKALSILNSPELKVDDKKEERLTRLKNILDERFNFREMSKRALGKEWNKLNKSDRSEFVDVFRELLETTYLDKIEQNASGKVLFTKERALGKNRLLIETMVVLSDRETPIHYNMMKSGDKWEIYDVKIEGVGLIKNYRTQFRDILQKKSYQELLKELKNKVENPQKSED